jgi:outer membrane protein TolC
MEYSRSSSLVAVVVGLSMTGPADIGAQEVTGLDGVTVPVIQDPPTLLLEDLLALARDRSPRVQAAHLVVEASRAREPAAGLLPDPTLQVGVMNLALPEFSATMPASMAPSVSATQRFPIAGKRSLREEIARTSTGIDAAAAQEVWWAVRAEVASAFYELYAMDRRIEVLERTLGLLQDFQAVATALYATGEGHQADVIRAGVEVARMDAEILLHSSHRRGAASRLNALVNRPAETRVPAAELGFLPLQVPAHEVLREWALESRPAIDALRLEIARADSRHELAEKGIWPDLTFGLQYGLGRMNGDLQSMGGVLVGFSIPIYAGKRQRKVEDEAAALGRVAQARLEGAMATLDSGIGSLEAELDRGRGLVRLYQEDVLPQARAAVESSLSSYQSGTIDFTTLIDAQRAVDRFEEEYFGLLAAYGVAVAQLESTIGRELPTMGESLLEVR